MEPKVVCGQLTHCQLCVLLFSLTQPGAGEENIGATNEGPALWRKAVVGFFLTDHLDVKGCNTHNNQCGHRELHYCFI